MCHVEAVQDDADSHIKECLIKARVTRALKAMIARFAKTRGESEGVIIREALNAYFDRELNSRETAEDS